MTDDLPETAEALSGLSGQMERLDQLAAQFGKSLSRALSSGIAQGRSFDDILRGLGQRLIDISLRAAFQPIESSISGLIGGLGSSLTNLFTGGGSGGGDLLSGFFGGASGPAAIPGLSGFFSGAAPSAAAGVIVNMAVTTPDADSFRRSEAQLSASLARAVARGQRAL